MFRRASPEDDDDDIAWLLSHADGINDGEEGGMSSTSVPEGSKTVGMVCVAHSMESSHDMVLSRPRLQRGRSNCMLLCCA